MALSGGWFFVVASEAITVGNTTVTLPGIGSWLSLAIARQDMKAVYGAQAEIGVSRCLAFRTAHRAALCLSDEAVIFFGPRPA